MTGYRNLLMFGKIPNFWCGNTSRNQPSNNDILCTIKCIRNFRHSRHQIKGGPKPILKLNGIENGLPPSMKRAWKPIIFTIVFSSASIGAAAVWQYENNRSYNKSLFKNPGHWFESSLNRQKRGGLRQELNRLWNSLSEGEKVFFPICFINVLVYIAWQIPKFQPTLLKYFCSNPASTALCWPLVLSTFSHYSFLHLAANMYVLHSFSEGTVSTLGKEQFVGLYLAAGCISSLTSLLYKSAFGISGLSLGASGAIMAIIGYVCTAYPNTEMSLIFLPFLHFKAHHAIKAIMALDAAGLLFKWQFFDHAAHLGGAIIGIGWYYYGNYYIWQNRRYVVQAWHDFRSSFD